MTVAKPKPPPCKCKRYGFPHRRTRECADDPNEPMRHDEKLSQLIRDMMRGGPR